MCVYVCMDVCVQYHGHAVADDVMVAGESITCQFGRQSTSFQLNINDLLEN